MEALEAYPPFRQADTVLLYYSLPDEVSTHDFIRRWCRSKQLLLPVVVGDELELRRYTGPDDMAIGAYGIAEPTGEASLRGRPSTWPWCPVWRLMPGAIA